MLSINASSSECYVNDGILHSLSLVKKGPFYPLFTPG